MHRHIKKSFVLSALAISLLASSSVTAYGLCPFDSFYGGISIGKSLNVSNITVNNRLSFSVPVAFGDSVIENKHYRTLNKESFTGSLFAGYGYSMSRWYLGGELFVREARTENSNTNTNNSRDNLAGVNITAFSENYYIRSRLKNFEYGLDIRPGILLAPTSLLYLRLGLGVNELSVTNISSFDVSGVATGFSNPLFSPTSSAIEGLKKKNLIAWRVGFGMEQKLNACWSIRMDYVYTHYKKLRMGTSFNEAVTDITGNRITSIINTITNAKVHNHSVVLGLSYYW